jgi:hypothetical protein
MLDQEQRHTLRRYDVSKRGNQVPRLVRIQSRRRFVQQYHLGPRRQRLADLNEATGPQRKPYNLPIGEMGQVQYIDNFAYNSGLLLAWRAQTRTIEKIPPQAVALMVKSVGQAQVLANRQISEELGVLKRAGQPTNRTLVRRLMGHVRALDVHLTVAWRQQA